jgi:hypothetical protein
MEHAHYTYLLEAEAQTFPLHQVGGTDIIVRPIG